jgi:hypothetical protein
MVCPSPTHGASLTTVRGEGVAGAHHGTSRASGTGVNLERTLVDEEVLLEPLSKRLRRLKLLETDQAAADRQECLVDIGATLVAHP